jgi:RNA polymerase sigma-70 factor (ECF subfamily)
VVGRPRTDDELIEQARAGDTRAYEELVRRHEEVAFRTAYVFTRSAADAEEAAQDAFVKAYAALGRFRLGAPLRPWLLRIVANEARNRRRAAGVRAGLARRAAWERPPGEAAPSPEGALLAGESREELLAVLAGLPERDRLVVSCRFLLSLSEAETAAVLRCRPGTVKSRLSRALARMRLALEERDG